MIIEKRKTRMRDILHEREKTEYFFKKCITSFQRASIYRYMLFVTVIGTNKQ